MKKSGKKWLLWTVKILLIVAVYQILTRYGINPFWSVLIMLYWRTVVKLGLLLGGLMYLTAGII